jgi:hypothetical protein
VTVTFLTWIGVTKRDSGASARQDSLLTNGSLVERLGQFADLEDAPGPRTSHQWVLNPSVPLFRSGPTPERPRSVIRQGSRRVS